MRPILFLFCLLVLTILIEGTVLFIWKKSKEVLIDSLYVNLLTNPPLNLTLLLLSGNGCSLQLYWTMLAILEIAVVFVEAVAYKFMMGIGFKGSLWLSLILNLISFIVGVLIGMVGYWRLLAWMMNL